MIYYKYSEVIDFFMDFIKFTIFKIKYEINSEKLEYSMAGFRHFCYIRERLLVI